MSASKASEQQPVAPSPFLTVARSLPALVALAVAGLVPLWGVYSLDWSVFAVVFAYIVQAAVAGLLSRRRAQRAMGQSSRPKDDVLISEFFKTYMTVVLVAALIASMVFGGRLLKPSGGTPHNVYAALSTWQYWAVVGVLVAAELAVFLWDSLRDADDLPPEVFVAEPLRRLFVLQGAALVLGLAVYWKGSSQAGIAAIVLAETAGVVVMAAVARQREARVRAALRAGAVIKSARPAKSRPRGGRKRSRKH